MLVGCAVLLSASFVTRVEAQLTDASRWADSARVAIEAASDKGDDPALEEVVAMLDRVLTVTPDEPMLLHYKGYALYRRGGLLMGQRKNKDAKRVLEEADDILEKSAKALRWPETIALRAAVLGQIIGADGGNPITAMRNGMRSGSLMSDAVEAGRENPRVWILKGIGDLHTPRMFGGGADKSEQSLKRGLALLESDSPAPPLPAWGRVDVHLWLGQAYAEQGKKEQARAEFQKVLQLVPDHAWVVNVLLPELDKSCARRRRGCVSSRSTTRAGCRTGCSMASRCSSSAPARPSRGRCGRASGVCSGAERSDSSCARSWGVSWRPPDGEVRGVARCSCSARRSSPLPRVTSAGRS
jgi:tetratricopeptide (TPR) repeat protein